MLGGLMPAYRVSSGDFEITLVRGDMIEAANDAIATLKEGNFDKIKLGMLTEVCLMYGGNGDGEDEDPMFLPTLSLVQRHGLTYRHAGETVNANSNRTS